VDRRADEAKAIADEFTVRRRRYEARIQQFRRLMCARRQGVPLPNGQQIARIVDAYRLDAGHKGSRRSIVADAIEVGRHKLMPPPRRSFVGVPSKGAEPSSSFSE
jgi:hypothetical protein